LRESVTDDGLRIRNYFPPAFADDLEADFDLTADVIDFSEELFGADYPFDEYGSIVLPFSLGFALENQTISVHGLNATDPSIITHEIMHQWAGNSVTLGDWQDIWMNEGFATYLAYLYSEDRGLPSDIEPVGMYAALSGGSNGPAEVPIDELFGTSVYFRGAMALHALRVEVGDDAFRDILAIYYERFAGGDITTDQFLDLVDEIAGPDAVAVLEDWLYGDELPEFPE
jgi:aminopeptidase N